MRNKTALSSKDQVAIVLAIGVGALSFNRPAVSAETFVPIEVGTSYQVELGGKGEADLQYPVRNICTTINLVKRCTVTMGGREISVRGKTNAEIVFNQDNSFQIKVLEKSKNGRLITAGGLLTGTYTQNPKNNKLKLKLDKESRQVDALGVFPNMAEIGNYVKARAGLFGTFYPMYNHMGGKLKQSESGEDVLILQLNQGFRSTKGYMIETQIALCPNQCQALKNALD